MGDLHQKYWDLAFSSTEKIKVSTNFRGQMNQINKLLKNDKTAMVSSIMDYQINAATVEMNINTGNTNLTGMYDGWKKNVNCDLNIDIPRGLRSFTEQYFRERWKSSFVVVRIKWGKDNGYIVPKIMYLMDGASIYAENDKKLLNTVKYSLGKLNDNKSNILRNSENETIIVRKPGNQWYELYPIPYLVRKGSMYHGMFKNKILDRQAEIINTAFPYQMMIKIGTDNAINKNQRPTETQLKDTLQQFKDRKKEYDEHEHSKGLAGAFPSDVNFEELIPDYLKAVDEKILRGVDKNLLASLGMIELKGFAQNREESILNPKVLMTEVNDGVLDYVELINEIVALTQEKNKNDVDVSVSPGIIETFVTDNMRTLVRSWYDRGVVSMEDGLEGTTSLNFKTQVIKRDKERDDKLDVRCYPRVVQNLPQDSGDSTDSAPSDDVPDDKKTGTPEAENFKNASEEIEYITALMKTTESIPEDFRAELSKENQIIFKNAFNKQFKICTDLKYDDKLRDNKSFEYACRVVTGK